MKKLTIYLFFVLTLSILSVDTMAAAATLPPLDKISFQLSAEQWATSTTAKIVISINASLTDTQLGTIHAEIMNNLQKIAMNVDWHITAFERSKNQSGLEQLYAQAEARIPQNQLSELRKNATAISKPGITYTIAAIDFSPSQAEIATVKANLRQQIYNEVLLELQRLNKIYSNQKFQLYAIDFINPEVVMPMAKMQTTMVAETNAAVSSKVVLTANVIVASNFQVD